MTHRGDVHEVRYVQGTSSKFYRVTSIWDPNEADFRVLFQWGRINSAGQSNVATFANHWEMEAAADKKLDEKRNKGYERHWDHHYDTVPPDVLKQAAVNERSQKEAVAKVDADPFAGATVLLDKAMRLTTGTLADQAEAIVVSHSLHDSLDQLRTRLLELEGAVEVVDATIAHKIGLPVR